MDLFTPAALEDDAGRIHVEAEDDAPAERRVATTPDGWLYDERTGEVLGLADDVDDEGRSLGLRGVDGRFEVDSEEAANWTLMVRTQIESDLLALEARRKAVNAQIDALIAERRRRLSWWEYRFQPSLVEFARTLLKGKGRTAQFIWGKVAFRKTKGSTAILDPDTALEYVETFAPSLVSRKAWVTVAAINQAALIAEDATGEPQVLSFVARSGESESVTVSTGLEVPGGKRGD